jgi:hypothetical protein
MRGAFKPRFLSSLVSIDVKYHHRGFDWEVVDELVGTTAGGVCKRTTWAGVARASYVPVHPRPVELQLDSVQGTGCIEMSAQGVAVECNENNVPKVQRDQLQASVRLGAYDWFAEDENSIFKQNLQLAQSGAVICILFHLFEAFG